MTPAECEIELQDNLQQSLQQALALKEFLIDERQALQARDVDSMHAVAEKKNACVTAIEELEQSRLNLASQCGVSALTGAVTALIEWSHREASNGPSGMQKTWNTFLGIAAECSAINSGNGSIIHVRQAQVGNAMGLLRSGSIPNNTYGPTGLNAGEHGTRSLAEA